MLRSLSKALTARSHRTLLLGTLALTASISSQPAFAQSNEFTLGTDGSWVQTDAPAPDSDEAIIAQARRFLAEDRPAQARTMLDSWIRQNERTGSPWLPDALVLRGDSLTMLGDEYNALYDYERVIKEFTGSSAFVTAVERELDIGVRYVNGYRRTFLGMRIVDASDIGEELLIRVQERMPGSRLAERAGIELADHYYRIRDLKLAAEAYDLFLRNYPNSQYHQKAMQRRVYATIARYKGPKYDGSSLLDSQVLIRRFRNMYPAKASEAGLDEALLSRIDESAAAELYESARWYLAQGDEVAARYVLRRLVRERPRTAAAVRALEFLQQRGWMEPAREAALPRTTQVQPDDTAPADPAVTLDPDREAGVATGTGAEGEVAR
ncbi:MAG: outer membrane protein assembly factor BamD [Phycisphaeraceae bacterium]|nr:outer membrane protein assembly factor BamD [Phycisphaeraceae bacterium]